jgi:hypothetical protein
MNDYQKKAAKARVFVTMTGFALLVVALVWHRLFH